MQNPKVEVLLKLEIGPKTLFLVLSNDLIPSKYWYEEHTCPTNFLGYTQEIYMLGPNGLEVDPHGLFEVIGYREAPENGLESFSSQPNDATEYWHNTVTKAAAGLPTDLLPPQE